MPESNEREKAEAPAQSAVARAVKDPVSRRKFMALTGGSAAAAAFLAACGSDSDTTTTTITARAAGSSETAQFGKGDIGILNYALTLEYLETAFYADVVKSGLFKGADLATIKKFGEEEAEHVSALTAAVKQLGGKPAPEPKTEFPLESAKSVLELAGTVENLGAAAYLGQAGNIKSPEVLASALAIHSVEGRHAAALNTLLGNSITPDGAFAKPATPRPSSSPSNPSSSASRRESEKEKAMSHARTCTSRARRRRGRRGQRRPLAQRRDPQGSAGRRCRLRHLHGRSLRPQGVGDAGGSDVDILNFALTLEYLESTFYKEAKTRAKASGELKSLIGLLADDEKQHVEALTATIKQLGGKPVAEPKFDFPYSDTAGFLKLAQTFEDTGVSAYNGAGPMIKSKEVLGAAGSIVQVEARHAAAIRLQNKEEPAPEAFDPSLDEAQVLKAVEPFIA